MTCPRSHNQGTWLSLEFFSILNWHICPSHLMFVSWSGQRVYYCAHNTHFLIMRIREQIKGSEPERVRHLWNTILALRQATWDRTWKTSEFIISFLILYWLPPPTSLYWRSTVGFGWFKSITFIQQIFIECLLYARYHSKCWGYINVQKKN